MVRLSFDDNIASRWDYIWISHRKVWQKEDNDDCECLSSYFMVDSWVCNSVQCGDVVRTVDGWENYRRNHDWSRIDARSHLCVRNLSSEFARTDDIAVVAIQYRTRYMHDLFARFSNSCEYDCAIIKPI